MADLKDSTRVTWPVRAVVTAGMPYGNKPLHFGHIGGVFVPADAFARFLRDRIGAENVRFVSGTDCFGSPINEGYRKLVEAGEFSGTIADYVLANHERQAATLEAFQVSLDIYDGSGIGHAGDVHQMVTDQFISRLHEQGHLRLDSTLQFYDAEAGTFLNGRQVQGRCPVQGCKSEHGYADECDLGHQYAPVDLIAPVSTLTGTTPEMRPVENWYFDLPDFEAFLKGRVDDLRADDEVRPVVPQTIAEFLVPPVVFVKNEHLDDYRALADQLPPHSFREAEGNKSSFEIEFADIEARDAARTVLAGAGIRFRTSKTLVPFRITGNIEWGVAAPVIDGVEGLTVWCWPESLWAPISFTIAANDERGLPRGSWRDFWCSDDARVYQFIGQDNLYFYGVAQPALWEALGEGGLFDDGEDSRLRQTTLVANHHMLFGKKKASSSGAVKPPTGEQLLEHYTPEQLRAHFLALGLDQKSVGFSPKPFDPDLAKRDDPRVADPALKEGALLTNVFNRLARSCFYEAQKNFDGCMPLGRVSDEVRRRAFQAMLDYEERMHRVQLHAVMTVSDEFIRWSNKYWADHIKAAEESGDEDARRQVLLDSFYLLRVACLLMHPIVPVGCEKICDYLSFGFDELFSWNYDFDSNEELCPAMEIDAGAHRIHELPPRFDFFRKHESQYK
ncbi:class I tRNA ligase family protein [Adlercreutzia mucosicola]|uniref:class I tRNA ligase family protein n=1 Tax=Adlercreutzia mucosicola TaxID=580026 RepID=UPI00048451A1|nr:class I tRNA ligase family protein [Adlercreutzia mucosicola]MCR2035507.1 class I tRNA ligase family protein [Adlercreutzia mucosicola]